MPRPKKAKEKILKYFSAMNPVIELSAFGQKVRFTPNEKTPEETIMKLLLSLDKAAVETKKKLIFVIDEVQQIATLEESHALEASIRHAVERSKNIFYIFSGSSRTLLEDMFKNKDRPLYYLCDEIKLNKISREHYHKFIMHAAKANWKKNIAIECIDEILRLTEMHPYYVNRICRTLWDMKAPPKIDDISEAWNDYVDMQKVEWASETISRLTVNQRTVMVALAKRPEREPRGKEFTLRVNMSASSIQRTIATLIRKDFVFKDKDGYYRVLNPVIKTYLSIDEYFEP